MENSIRFQSNSSNPISSGKVVSDDKSWVQGQNGLKPQQVALNLYEKLDGESLGGFGPKLKRLEELLSTFPQQQKTEVIAKFIDYCNSTEKSGDRSLASVLRSNAMVATKHPEVRPQKESPAKLPQATRVDAQALAPMKDRGIVPSRPQGPLKDQPFQIPNSAKARMTPLPPLPPIPSSKTPREKAGRKEAPSIAAKQTQPLEKKETELGVNDEIRIGKTSSSIREEGEVHAAPAPKAGLGFLDDIKRGTTLRKVSDEEKKSSRPASPIEEALMERRTAIDDDGVEDPDKWD